MYNQFIQVEDIRAKVNVLDGAPCWPGWVSALVSVICADDDDDDDEEEEDPLAPMITWKDFQRLMPWEIVILVGGGYALAAGCKVSVSERLYFRGLSEFLYCNAKKDYDKYK